MVLRGCFNELLRFFAVERLGDNPHVLF